MWRLSGELAVNCSTLVDLPRQTHGLRWMRDKLMAPPDRRLTLNGADDVQHIFSGVNVPNPTAWPSKMPLRKLSPNENKHMVEDLKLVGVDYRHITGNLRTSSYAKHRMGYKLQKAGLSCSIFSAEDYDLPTLLT